MANNVYHTNHPQVSQSGKLSETVVPIYGHGDLLASTPHYGCTESVNMLSGSSDDVSHCRPARQHSQFGSSVSLSSTPTTTHDRPVNAQHQPFRATKTCSSETKLDSFGSGHTTGSGHDRNRRKQRQLDHVGGSNHMGNGGRMDVSPGGGQQETSTSTRCHSQLVSTVDSNSSLHDNHNVSMDDNNTDIDDDNVSFTDTSTMSYVDKVVDELLDTERLYVRDLYDVITGYMSYISEKMSCKVSKEDFEHLFGNIVDIYRFNREFLLMLEDVGLDAVLIAECFIQKHNGFIIYSDYCTNFPRSVEVLERWLKDEEIVAVLRSQQLALRQALPLGTYLFKPVQRILKYHLLLKSIQSNYNAIDEAGFSVINTALEQMLDVAMQINEIKRQHERAMRTQEIYGALTNYQDVDLGALGDLVLEDVLRMSGVWGDRQVFVFLFRKEFLITKKRKDGLLHVKTSIKTSNLMLIESITREPLQFHVLQFDSPKVRYILQAKTAEQKQVWCQEIKRLIVETFEALIPEHAKQVVLGTNNNNNNNQPNTGSTGNAARSFAVKSNRVYQTMKPGRIRRKSIGAITKRRESSDVTNNMLNKSTTGTELSAMADNFTLQQTPSRLSRQSVNQLTPQRQRTGTAALDSAMPAMDTPLPPGTTPPPAGDKELNLLPVDLLSGSLRRSQSLDSVRDESVLITPTTERTSNSTDKLNSISQEAGLNSEEVGLKDSREAGLNDSGDNDETESEDVVEELTPTNRVGYIDRVGNLEINSKGQHVRVVPVVRADSFKQAMESTVPDYTRTLSDPSQRVTVRSKPTSSTSSCRDSRQSWNLPVFTSLEDVFGEWFQDAFGQPLSPCTAPAAAAERSRSQSETTSAAAAAAAAGAGSDGSRDRASVVLRRPSRSGDPATRSPLLTPEFRNKRLTRLFNDWDVVPPATTTTTTTTARRNLVRNATIPRETHGHSRDNRMSSFLTEDRFLPHFDTSLFGHDSSLFHRDSMFWPSASHQFSPLSVLTESSLQDSILSRQHGQESSWSNPGEDSLLSRALVSSQLLSAGTSSQRSVSPLHWSLPSSVVPPPDIPPPRSADSNVTVRKIKIIVEPRDKQGQGQGQGPIDGHVKCENGKMLTNTEDHLYTTPQAAAGTQPTASSQPPAAGTQSTAADCHCSINLPAGFVTNTCPADNTSHKVHVIPINVQSVSIPVEVQRVTSSLPVVTSPVPVVMSSLPVVTSSVPVVMSSLPVVTSSVPVMMSSLPVVTSPVPVGVQSTSRSSEGKRSSVETRMIPIAVHTANSSSASGISGISSGSGTGCSGTSSASGTTGCCIGVPVTVIHCSLATDSTDSVTSCTDAKCSGDVNCAIQSTAVCVPVCVTPTYSRLSLSTDSLVSNRGTGMSGVGGVGGVSREGDDSRRMMELFCCDADTDENQVKRILQEMTVSKLPVRETARLINLSVSRSMESLNDKQQEPIDSHQQHSLLRPLHSVPPTGSALTAGLSSPTTAGLSSPTTADLLPVGFCVEGFTSLALLPDVPLSLPVTGQLIRKRVHMFEHESL